MRTLAIVAPVTTRIRHIPTEVPLGIAEGLPKECVVNLDVIITVDKACLQEHICRLGPEKMQAVEEAIAFALGMQRRSEH